MIRDLLKTQGKRAQFVISGGRVEMDRSVLETLYDPLVHLLRNAIDHGLETPAERARAAKSHTASLRLTARRERESVVIVLEDDGRGMDSAQIAAAAIEQGLVTEEAVAEMSEGQILQLLCHPGFSTSSVVTVVSGRGVGMSVIKRAVEGLRGTLEIETQVGQGSTIRLRLPVMLTLLDAMLVQLGEEQYALPVAQVEHILEIEPAQIECIGGKEVIMVDDVMMPLRRMSRLLHVPNADPNPRYALIVRPNGNVVGLRVDAVLGREEIVARPLPVALRSIPALVGVTVMGEGQTVLILDVEEAVGEPGITGFHAGRQVGSSDPSGSP
jgi:two-component system chemotaxis sensor kinase CheA